jgi:hypothetical protein
VTLPIDFYTPSRIIRFARQDAGLLQTGDSIDSEDLADDMNRLNELSLAAQTQGLRLWLQLLQSVPLAAGKALYVFAPGGDVSMAKPSRIIQGYYLDSTGNQRPLIPLSWDDWNRLSNKTQQGQINSYFVDKQSYQLNVWFWLTPDANAATGTAQLLVQQQQPTATSLTDTMIFPPEWGIWLHWALADQICTGQPQAIMDRCEKRSLQYFEVLTNWDVEDAPTQFSPDVRGQQYSRLRR